VFHRVSPTCWRNGACVAETGNPPFLVRRQTVRRTKSSRNSSRRFRHAHCA
jgi:hypothetical protein